MNNSQLKKLEIKCDECEGTGNESNDHGGNCVYCDGHGVVYKQVIHKWLGPTLVTEDEYDEAVNKGEYEMQQQRDSKHE